MKKLIIYIGVSLLVIGLGVGAYFIFRDNPISTDAQTYVSISVNPAVEFTVNEDNQVISVVATDAEGDEIVQSYDFYGMDIDAACEMFTQLSMEAGYIDVDADETTGTSNEVVITVVNADEALQTQLRTRIRERIQTYFVNNGVFGYVSEEDLSEYAALAASYDLSVGQVKLIMRALEFNPDLTFDDVAAMPTNEVVALVNAEHKLMQQTTAAIRTQLRADIQTLKESETYAPMFAALDQISDLQEQLLDTSALTQQEIDALQAQLDQATAAFTSTYTELLEQFQADKAVLVQQAQTDAASLLNEVKTNYQAKVNTQKANMNALRERLQSQGDDLKNRITTWLQDQETQD